MIPLPIDLVVPEAVEALRKNSALVLEAPPGSGKTTRIPPALMKSGAFGTGEIIVLQPRRLATRLASARIAYELGEKLGSTVGYQVRFEDVTSRDTKIRFLTEGLLTRKLLSDPSLRGAQIVVLDEFHERHIATDLALAMLRRLQTTTRPDLKLVVMSATLDAEPVARWLGDAPRIRSQGRPFDVEIEHLNAEDERPIDQQVLGALKRLLQKGVDGDVLVFLPGAGEIRRCLSTCEELAGRHAIELAPLYGELSSADQDRAVQPGSKRKVIFSTNVAETSVTIEGIGAVIDSGVARVAAYSPWSGLPTLKLQKISKASAIQRAGRAGRTRSGVVMRLYTRSDFEQRPASDLPEIHRVDLAEAALALHAGGVTQLSSFSFFEPPRQPAVEAADTLLRQLGAIDETGAMTELGTRMVRFPVHPRLSKLLLESEKRGLARDGAAMAALLQEREIRQEVRGRNSRSHTTAADSDVLELLERYRHGQSSGARAAGLETGTFNSVERVERQLLKLLDAAQRPEGNRSESLMLSVLSAWPDRIAKRRKANQPQLVLAGGGSATLDETSVVLEPELMVALDAEERRGGVFVRLASKVEPEWILDALPHVLEELDELSWNETSERVERLTRLAVGNVVLEEVRKPAPPSDAATRLLAAQAMAKGPKHFADPAALETLSNRLQVLRSAYPNLQFPQLDDTTIRNTLEQLCAGMTTFNELREANLLQALHNQLTPEQSRTLSKEAPERFALKHGRTMEIHYEAGKPPWVESRLQDFFGSSQGPSICGGRVPLVLHLLAPNYRAVQVTTDLAGFWDRHYPAVRRELMRQYPKHSWPEDPRTAQPPVPKPRPHR